MVGTKPATATHGNRTARASGKEMWAVDAKAKEIERFHSVSSPASGTIATDGERIYAYFGSRGLLCYDFEGNHLWTVAMPLPGLHNGSGASPTVAGDLVLLNREQNDGPYVLAVDKKTGVEVWRHEHVVPPSPFNRSSATPVVWNDQVIVHMQSGVHALALSDGKSIWQVNARTNGIATPLIRENTVFVSTFIPFGEPLNRGKLPTFAELLESDADKSGTIQPQEIPWKYLLFSRPQSTPKAANAGNLRFAWGRIDANHDGEVTEKEWNTFVEQFKSIEDNSLLAIELGGEGDVTERRVKRLLRRSTPEVTSPVLHGARLYTVNDGGIVNCVDVTTGKQLFRSRLPTLGSYFASPIVVNDNVYFASLSGVVTVVRAGDRLDVIGENDLGEEIKATPAVAAGVLYVRTEEHLYAFETESDRSP